MPPPRVPPRTTCEALAVEVAWSFPAVRVVAILDQLIAIHGAPDALRLDNGPEWISEAVRAWAAQHGVRLLSPPAPPPTSTADRTAREDVDHAVFSGDPDRHSYAGQSGNNVPVIKKATFRRDTKCQKLHAARMQATH